MENRSKIKMKKKIEIAIGVIFAALVCTACMSAQKNDMELVDKRGVKEDGKNISFFSNVGSFAEFESSVKENGDYGIFLKVQNKNREKDLASIKVEVDGKYFCTQKLEVTNESFSDVYINRVANLEKGKHSVKISVPYFGFTISSISLQKADDNFKNQIAHPSLVSKHSSDKTKAVYKYLCDMQGKGILSGQQIYSKQDEIKTIKKETGKTPAILGIDFIDYTPSRVERGATSISVFDAEDWSKDGGLVTIAWHWNAPKDLLDQDRPEMHWWDGYRTKATKFDFTIGLNDPDSEEYELMIRDMDAIAELLLELEAYDVPVLWRPLHEASGKWFWWGSKGAENYIKLYRFLFDYLENEYELTNLIWVWNGQDPAWYPGDEYVDIISYDSYPGKQDYQPVYDKLELIQSATSQAKLCAISENGTLPDINQLAEDKGLWSWFCTWNGDFVIDSKNNYNEAYTDLETFKSYYANDFLITKEDLPEF